MSQGNDDGRGGSGSVRPWVIEGAEGREILGDEHLPAEGRAPNAAVLILHGFMGYKDYGFLPYVARAMAGRAAIAHRFNFSHSGMTNETATFARPELFAEDTWNKQVADVGAVIEAIGRGRLGGAGLPIVLVGHSRGGMTACLAAGRRFRAAAKDEAVVVPAGVVTLAAPSYTWRHTEEEKREWLERGYMEAPSQRTGQMLRRNARWLKEQMDDPAGHDAEAHIGAIGCPMLVVHGARDQTVNPRCAAEIAGAALASPHVRLIRLPNGDHVFNTGNPFAAEGPAGENLGRTVEAVGGFVEECACVRAKTARKRIGRGA